MAKHMSLREDARGNRATKWSSATLFRKGTSSPDIPGLSSYLSVQHAVTRKYKRFTNLAEFVNRGWLHISILSALLYLLLRNGKVIEPPSSGSSSVAVSRANGFFNGEGIIYFIDWEQVKKYHVQSCRPCGPSYTLCSGSTLEVANHSVIFVQPVDPRRIQHLRDGGHFSCHLTPDYFEGYDTWHRQPLKISIDRNEPVRLNVLMTGVGRDLTGGPLSIMRFMNSVLKGTRVAVRWVNVDGNGLNAEELREHLELYPDMELFRSRSSFVYDAMNRNCDPILVNENDMFMATLYYSALICSATVKHRDLRNKNFVYFIQDFEPIFFPHDSRHLEALETYTKPHFPIYSTDFLAKWFREKKYGQHEFLETAEGLARGDIASLSFASEPAIKPWGNFDKAIFSDTSRVRKLIVYARRHADRNAYDLTINSLSAAVCAGILDDTWLILGVGAVSEDVEYLGMPCGKRIRMDIKLNIPEPMYREIVRTGDVGLSLMVSPHPSLPPFDFVSAGLVTVTNSFETKTEEMFKDVSDLFIVSRPYQDDIVLALKRAVILSSNITYRSALSEQINWESKWDGEKCYGKPLMRKIESWFERQEPLWSIVSLPV